MTAYRPTVPPLHEARVFDWIRQHLLGHVVTAEEIETAVAGKRDPHFDRLRNNRLAIGHLRYGTCGWSGNTNYDVIASCIARLTEYRQTGNREHLVDVCNLVEIEWVHSSQEGTYWEAQDCGGHWSLRNQSAPTPTEQEAIERR